MSTLAHGLASTVDTRPHMDLASRARRAIERHGLCAPGSRVLVALSGGADSVALLLLLRDLEAAGDLTVAGAAHLNHCVRGAAADEDEAFCAALARDLRVPFVSDRIDVAALARAGRRSIEDAARTARYAFLERAADRCAAAAIAVAHTKEDQAETFLLRLLRGSGTRGLAAIRPRAGRVIRPLLDVERGALRSYLAGRSQTFREDASNADVTIPRNRVRHELIPFLESRFSGAVAGVLARQAAVARHDEDFLRGEAIALAARIVSRGDAITIDAAGLAAAPRALSSRVALEVLQALAGSKAVTFDHVERLLDLADGQAICLPGQYAVRTADRITLQASSGRGPVASAPRGRDAGPRGGRRDGGPHRRRRGAGDDGGGNSFALSLPVPGEVRLRPCGVAVAAEHLLDPAGRQKKWAARGPEVGVAAGALELPLGVRSRRPGDRFRPLGAPGVRKLQDFLVDRKIARHLRETVPLVVDGRDRIVWVVGESVAEEFRITDPAQGVLLLKVRRLGGSG